MTSDLAREHGGNVAAAAERFGVADMVDLSTGISPVFYPASPVLAAQWQALPTDMAMDECLAAARAYYKVPPQLEIVAGPGTQALLQMIPHYVAPGTAWIKQPTYNEHAPAWQHAGHNLCGGEDLPASATHAVIVAPNNPTGEVDIESIVKCATQVQDRGGCLVIDGAFADGECGEVTLEKVKHNPAVIHLRSFGKFFGMAGLRLGFAIGPQDMIVRLGERAGPWAVNAAALQIGCEAMADRRWIDTHHVWLLENSVKLAAMINAHGFEIAGGTTLFQTICYEGAHDLHKHLARTGLWTRKFENFPTLLRFGLPGNDSEWDRLKTALSSYEKAAESN